MSAFQPGIPTGTVNLDVDYQNLQNNFGQLDTTFGINHLKFSNQTAQNGYHTQVNFVPFSTTTTNPTNNYPPIAPANTPGYGQLWSAEVNDGINTDEALFWLSGENRSAQLTRNFAPIAENNGVTFLPGGIIMQWGVVVSPGTSGTVTFSDNTFAFPAHIYNVQLTLERSNASQTAAVQSTSLTGFNYLTSSGGSAFLFWTALGN
jgi:hypothetical protein